MEACSWTDTRASALARRMAAGIDPVGHFLLAPARCTRSAKVAAALRSERAQAFVQEHFLAASRSPLSREMPHPITRRTMHFTGQLDSLSRHASETIWQKTRVF